MVYERELLSVPCGSFFSLFIWNLIFGSNEIKLFGFLAKALLKVKVFAWLVAHRKVNTNDLLQVKRPFKSLNPQWCILCKREGKAIDHLFFIAHTLFGYGISFLIQLDWYGFPQGKLKICLLPLKVLEVVLETRLCGTLYAFLWYGLFDERNARIFEDKERERKGKCETYLLIFLFVGFMYPYI